MNRPPGSRPLWLRALRWLGLAVLVLGVAAGARLLYALRDRHPGYTVAVSIPSAPSIAEPRPLRAGFARERINPDLSDPDRPAWLAGFGQNRRATAIHDDLWAVATVIDDGHTRVGFVALDAIGLFHDDVIAIRQGLAADLRLGYVVVCATHNHSTPDLMGLWGPHPLRSGVDPRYRELALGGARRALAAAVAALAPAELVLHEIQVPPDGLVADTRPPKVFDADVRVMQFLAPGTSITLGSLVTWGNHPETPWSGNTEITADFCGFLRDALEQGIRQDGRTVLRGVGGIHCFINGAVGGLMTTHPSVTVRDPVLERNIQAPGHDKSRAVGRQLASRILPRLQQPGRGTRHAPIAVEARTLELPVANPIFMLAPALGLIDRGQPRWGRIRTEVAVLRCGEATLACIPGEIYPEIVNGGIERAPGGDFDVAPVEVPPLRELLPGRVRFVLGLANDELGYIIPKSEWDEQPPYLYGAKKRVYGEVNSLGPETAPLLHAAVRELAGKLR